MPLERGIGDPIEEIRGGVIFPMTDGRRLVPCTVLSDALAEIAGGTIEVPRYTFVIYRHKIEMAASAKYDRGETDGDGGVTLAAGDFLSDPAPTA